MSTEEHLIENALLAYHKGKSAHAVANDRIVAEQCKQCNVPVDAVVEFVNYVYWTLLDAEDRMKIFEAMWPSSTRNVIFLDCDGVVNRASFDGDHRYFTPECFYQLRRIVAVTNAKIVLSTSWREFTDWENMLRDFLGALDIKVVGKTKVIDRVPNEKHDNHRAHEIQTYLDEHKGEFDNYVVLDDIDMREHFPGHCVCTCTRNRIGLDEKWADEAIAILNRKEETDKK